MNGKTWGRMRSRFRYRNAMAVFFVISTHIFGAIAKAQSDGGDEDFTTGAIPLSEAEFAKLPKTPTFRAFLPESVDLSARLPPIGHQGRQSSCVAWAVGYAARSYYVAALEGRDVRSAANVPSPAFIYNSITERPGYCEQGTSIVSALALLKQGVPSLLEAPYDPKQCERPSDQQLTRTHRDFQILDWTAIETSKIDQIKGELAKGNPVIISINGTKRFTALKVGEIYTAPLPVDTTDWHALAVVGYDEGRQAFKVANSWGHRWAERGFGWINYASFAFSDRVREAYVMRLAELPKPPAPLIPPTVIVRPPSPIAPTPGPSPLLVTPKFNFQNIDCSKLSVLTRGGKTVVSGFVGSDASLEKVRAQAAPFQITLETVVRPWPQCEALLTLDREIAADDRPRVKILHEHSDLSTDELLKFEIETPNYPSFLHVAYIQADGSVLNLVQPDDLDLQAFAPKSHIGLGDKVGGPRFRVTAPYGREMLIVLAGRSPVFAHSRPLQETEREFLSGLRSALLGPSMNDAAKRAVSAAYDSIVTSDTGVINTEPSAQ